jgi:hypothetical protein
MSDRETKSCKRVLLGWGRDQRQTISTVRRLSSEQRRKKTEEELKGLPNSAPAEAKTRNCPEIFLSQRAVRDRNRQLERMVRPSSWHPISVHPSTHLPPDRVCRSYSAVKSCCANETTGNFRVRYSQLVFRFKGLMWPQKLMEKSFTIRDHIKPWTGLAFCFC